MQPGETLEDRYLIEREIGRGNFGIVYLAKDLQTNKSLAIKILLPAANKDQALRHRLSREAKLVGMLNSKHAVRIEHLSETTDGTLYIVMEFLDGQELADLLEASGPLSGQRVETIAKQILEVLGESHKLGVIHRDIKPSNIFLCKNENGTEFVKVFDFGIAKVAGNTAGGLTETTKLTIAGGVLGTPLYMSPEQCRGDKLTPASDIYSLGIVLYELLSGNVPFSDSNPVQVMLMHNSQPAAALPAAIANTPLGLAVMRSLEKNLGDRFANAEDFLRAIGSSPEEIVVDNVQSESRKTVLTATVSNTVEEHQVAVSVAQPTTKITTRSSRPAENHPARATRPAHQSVPKPSGFQAIGSWFSKNLILILVGILVAVLIISRFL